jgi:hypothetical protein
MYEVREQLCCLHFLLLSRVAGPKLSDYGPSTPVLKSYYVIAGPGPDEQSVKKQRNGKSSDRLGKVNSRGEKEEPALG